MRAIQKTAVERAAVAHAADGRAAGRVSMTNGSKNAHSSSVRRPRTTADLLHEDQLRIILSRVGGIPQLRFVHAT